MRSLLTILLITLPFAALTGCNTPSPAFAGEPATRVTIDGSVFDIRVKDRKAEAIRLNPQYAPRLGPIGARAAIAMEHISGCEVTKVTGDAAVVFGKLRCGKDPVRPPYAGLPGGTLDCYGIDSYKSPATGELVTSYDCDWRPASG